MKTLCRRLVGRMRRLGHGLIRSVTRKTHGATVVACLIASAWTVIGWASGLAQAQGDSPTSSASPAASPASSPAASPAASPDSSAASAEGTDEAKASPEAGETEGSEDAEAPASPKSVKPTKKETDIFDKLIDQVFPLPLDKEAHAPLVRNPFVLTGKLSAKATSSAEEGKTPGTSPSAAPTPILPALYYMSPMERAAQLKITGVFVGQRVRAIRIDGMRIEEGEWFTQNPPSGRTVKRAGLGEKADFRLDKVTARSIILMHRSGEIVERDTRLRRQIAFTAQSATPPVDSSPAPK